MAYASLPVSNWKKAQENPKKGNSLSLFLYDGVKL